MTVLDALADYLEAEGLGTVASNIFVSFYPDHPDVVVALYETPGLMNDWTFRSATPVADSLEIQVRVRSEESDYPSARDLMHKVIRALERVVETNLGGHHFYAILKFNGPFLIFKDDHDRQTLASNFDVRVREANPV